MEKLKKNLSELALVFAILAVVLAGFFSYAIYFGDDDTRLGAKKMLNDTGLFHFDLQEELKPRPIKIGVYKYEVIASCGLADDEHSFESARGTTITLHYKNPTKPECDGTFTFDNGKLISISRSKY